MRRTKWNFIRTSRLQWAVWVTLGVSCAGAIGCRSERAPRGGEAGQTGAVESRPATPAEVVMTPDLVAKVNRGVALMGRFQYSAAAEVFAELVQQYPDWAEAGVNLALAQLNEDQGGQHAEPTLAKILQVYPNHVAANYCMGVVLMHGSRSAEALPYLEKVYAADPNDAYVTYLLGLCAEDTSKEKALEWYDKAIALDPMFATAHYRRKVLLQLSGQPEKAAEALAHFQNLRLCPISKSFQFKYTMMGGKAMAIQAGGPPPKRAASPGPVFAVAQSLLSRSEPVPATGVATITACDLDGDGRGDVYLTGTRSTDGGTAGAILWQQPDGNFREDIEHPLAKISDVTAAVWGDFNDDGLTDGYFCRQGPNQMWRQTEKGKWEDVTATTGTAAADRSTVDAAAFDADHDGDLDLFLVNADGPNEFLNNTRDANGSFQDISEQTGIAASQSPSRAVVMIDLDRDLDYDLVVIKSGSPHEVYRNDLGWKYERVTPAEAFGQASIVTAVAGDTDADGQAEIFAWGNDGLVRWVPESWTSWRREVLRPDWKVAEPPAQLALCDVQGDGRLELVAGRDSWQVVSTVPGDDPPLAASGDGPLATWSAACLDPTRGPAILGLSHEKGLLLWGPSENRQAFVALALAGKSQPEQRYRTSASGLGARAEIRVGSQWTIVDPVNSDSGPGQSLQPLVAGLGGAASADFVRIQWPDGIAQYELDVAPGFHRFEERDDMPTSCPVLFAWDGNKYGFVSDLLAVGGLGYLAAPGRYATPDPTENFLLPGGAVAEREGRYALKLTEPMQELTYLDRLALVAYDLPPGWQMTLDERLAVNPPDPTGEPRFFRRWCGPRRAINDRGEDVTASLAEADQRAAPVGTLDSRFLGRLASEHVLTLEFAEPLWAKDGRPWLVADGWVEFPYSQTVFAAWQARETFDAPTLEARDAHGQWQMVLEKFGYPGGMPRQMAVPLADLPTGTTALRIRTNQEIYWDRLAVVWEEDCPDVVRTPLRLAAAELRECGFMPRSVASQQRPEFDYDQRLPLADVRVPAGYYSQFGPVEELVARADNALAIFGPGEEIHLEFAQLPPAPAGWTRRFVVETVGWCKDMDPYTQNGQTVEPVPHVGPRDGPRDRLHRNHNTRYQQGRLLGR